MLERERNKRTTKAEPVRASMLHVGRDEMNLVEFPLGPIRATKDAMMEVEHEVWDKRLRRYVVRGMRIIGGEGLGLPRPIDDLVLVGMKALTYEQGFRSRKVFFTRYELCRLLGWSPDGRSYARLEACFDRIAGTTLKFKDAWYDKGQREWQSKTFHLVDEVQLCSRDAWDRQRLKWCNRGDATSSFVWNEVIWKSFSDGFIKRLDMQMFRRIAKGRRREVPMRLFRIIDKRCHERPFARFTLRRLCVNTLGLSADYSPSQLMRILSRAVSCLVQCGYLSGAVYEERGDRANSLITFQRAKSTPITHCRIMPCTTLPKDHRRGKDNSELLAKVPDALKAWLQQQSAGDLQSWEDAALAAEYGTALERELVRQSRAKHGNILAAGRLRQEFVKKYVDAVVIQTADAMSLATVTASTLPKSRSQ